MKETRSIEKTGHQRSWLEKLGQTLAGEPKNRDQLITVLREAEQRDIIDRDDLSMLEGVLQVDEMQVRDIMVPRSQMVVIEKGQSLKEFLPKVIDSAHSRFPVTEGDRDEVVGILLAKDLLKFLHNPEQDFAIDELLRPAYFVPESKRLDVILREFQHSQNHMALVVDEYGGVAGLVTIEDVLEQIVGEIEDEHDADNELFIKEHSDTEFIVNALTPIEEFNEHFHTELSDEEFDTIGGLVMKAFGHLPKRGESVDIGDHHFRVLHADNRRIRLLKVVLVETLEQ